MGESTLADQKSVPRQVDYYPGDPGKNNRKVVLAEPVMLKYVLRQEIFPKISPKGKKSLKYFENGQKPL